MTIYLILILLTVPGQTEPAQIVPAAWITASSAAVCQRTADAEAEAYQAKHADTVRRLGAKVTGKCERRGEVA